MTGKHVRGLHSATRLCPAPVLRLQHLLPLLAKPNSWDVLIGHYLGVDHAGHTYGVVSRQMEAKLDQMDSQVSHVIGGW
jgi:predicted AlkP superfamily pyrophosphatase or phosphodiesterase